MVRVTYSDGTTPNVCIIGAGFSGLLAGIQLKSKLRLKTFTIFDENQDVGGTWLVNTYPGCTCDVQSHLYSYSFEPNPYWSHNYSPQKEIWEYLRNVAKKYDLYRKIELNTQVKSITWDETVFKWRVVLFKKVNNTTQQRLFDIVINSPGFLRVPNVPQEFDAFKGPRLHTARWDPTVEWENKIVGVIGSGSSAIQVIPELASKAKELHSYQRKPAWVKTRVRFSVPAWVQFLFAYVPLLMLMFRWYIFLTLELYHKGFIGGSKLARFGTWRGLQFLKQKIPTDEKLRRDLTPQYKLGCKRIVVSEEYLPAMQRSNVKLHRSPILEVKPHSIVTSEGEQKLDLLVLATGYQSQNFSAPMKVIGKGGVDVMVQWKSEGPKTYYGTMSTVSPNQFVLLGPNTGLGHNSIIFMIECSMNLVIDLMAELMRRDAKVIELRPEAEERFQKYLADGLTKTVWGQEKCGSWYANAKGQITALWPYTCLRFWNDLREPDYSQFKFK